MEEPSVMDMFFPSSHQDTTEQEVQKSNGGGKFACRSSMMALMTLLSAELMYKVAARSAFSEACPAIVGLIAVGLAPLMPLRDKSSRQSDGGDSFTLGCSQQEILAAAWFVAGCFFRSQASSHSKVVKLEGDGWSDIYANALWELAFCGPQIAISQLRFPYRKTYMVLVAHLVSDIAVWLGGALNQAEVPNASSGEASIAPFWTFFLRLAVHIVITMMCLCQAYRFESMAREMIEVSSTLEYRHQVEERLVEVLDRVLCETYGCVAYTDASSTLNVLRGNEKLDEVFGGNVVGQPLLCRAHGVKESWRLVSYMRELIEQSKSSTPDVPFVHEQSNTEFEFQHSSGQSFRALTLAVYLPGSAKAGRKECVMIGFRCLPDLDEQLVNEIDPAALEANKKPDTSPQISAEDSAKLSITPDSAPVPVPEGAHPTAAAAEATKTRDKQVAVPHAAELPALAPRAAPAAPVAPAASAAPAAPAAPAALVPSAAPAAPVAPAAPAAPAASLAAPAASLAPAAPQMTVSRVWYIEPPPGISLPTDATSVSCESVKAPAAVEPPPALTSSPGLALSAAPGLVAPHSNFEPPPGMTSPFAAAPEVVVPIVATAPEASETPAAAGPQVVVSPVASANEGAPKNLNAVVAASKLPATGASKPAASVSRSPEPIKVSLEQNLATIQPRKSTGSWGHPDTCGEPCKFVWTIKGCKDGDQCLRCHMCTWKKTRAAPTATRAAPTARGEKDTGQSVLRPSYTTNNDKPKASGRRHDKRSRKKSPARVETRFEPQRSEQEAEPFNPEFDLPYVQENVMMDPLPVAVSELVDEYGSLRDPPSTFPTSFSPIGHGSKLAQFRDLPPDTRGEDIARDRKSVV